MNGAAGFGNSVIAERCNRGGGLDDSSAIALTEEGPELMEEQLDLVSEVYQLIVNFLVNYSFQLLGALLVLVLGFIVGGWISRAVLRLMEHRNVDQTLREFLAGVVKMIVVGDTITVQGCSGQVEEISLATTVLKTEDGELIVIPNKQIAGEIHTNSFENRVVEAQVGVAYSDDPERAISVIRDALAGIEGVTNEPPPQVGIAESGDSSVNIDYRFWVPTNHYFEVKHAANLAVFKALGAGGLNIPFPQREVRMLGEAV